MKKILFVLVTVMALSIVVFGFAANRSARTVNGNMARQAIRINIAQNLTAADSLSAQIRIIDNTTETLVYDSIITLRLRANKYVSEILFLDEGNYQVHAIAIMPDGKTPHFTNVHELVLNPAR